MWGWGSHDIQQEIVKFIYMYSLKMGRVEFDWSQTACAFVQNRIVLIVFDTIRWYELTNRDPINILATMSATDTIEKV